MMLYPQAHNSFFTASSPFSFPSSPPPSSKNFPSSRDIIAFLQSPFSGLSLPCNCPSNKPSAKRLLCSEPPYHNNQIKDSGIYNSHQSPKSSSLSRFPPFPTPPHSFP